MSTSYNTLTLREEEPRKARKTVVYAVLGLAVVAMAGAAAFLVSGAGHAASVSDASFSAEAGDVVKCHDTAVGFLESLPKYDPDYLDDNEEFYNACYYSFRCCTTTGNSAHCYVSENFGINCQDCLGRNGPRMTNNVCRNYLNHVDAKGEPWDTTTEGMEKQAPQFDEESLHMDIVPEPRSANLILSFKDKTTCWPQAGPDDVRMKKYKTDCFEVLSWCNLLCPRDAANSVQHNMCKHCTLFGFAKAEEPIKERIGNQKEVRDDLLELKKYDAAAERNAWEMKWMKNK